MDNAWHAMHNHIFVYNSCTLTHQEKSCGILLVVSSPNFGPMMFCITLHIYHHHIIFFSQFHFATWSIPNTILYTLVLYSDKTSGFNIQKNQNTFQTWQTVYTYHEFDFMKASLIFLFSRSDCFRINFSIFFINNVWWNFEWHGACS